jgi:hypothetical protein
VYHARYAPFPLGKGNAGLIVSEMGLSRDNLPNGPYWKPGLTRDGQNVVTVESWWSDGYAIQVAFDEQGKVVGGYLIRVYWVSD